MAGRLPDLLSAFIAALKEQLAHRTRTHAPVTVLLCILYCVFVFVFVFVCHCVFTFLYTPDNYFELIRINWLFNCIVAIYHGDVSMC